MNRTSQFLLLILSLPGFLFAQANYQPGVTVDLKGDTIHGYINYREWESNPKSISFKTSANGAPVTLRAGDIRYFSVQVGHLAEYISYKGPISTDNTNTTLNHISVGRDTSFVEEVVFLKVVHEGKNLVLLSYTDEQKVRFYIAANLNSLPSELVYRVYYNSIEENGRDRTVSENTYKGQLYDAAVKSGAMTGSLKDKIKNAGYAEDNIVEIASAINGISATDLTKNNPTKPKVVNKTIAIIGGLAVLVGLVIEFASIKSR